jgi:hypothetical protein
MAFSWKERPDSRQFSDVPPTATLKYHATGQQDETTVFALASNLLPAIYAHPSGSLVYRQKITVAPAGFAIYQVDAEYGEQKKDGTPQLSFDTTGGTIHITASKETIAAYGSGAAVSDWKQAIGITGPAEPPQGTDVIIPVLKLTATLRHNPWRNHAGHN